MQKKYLDYFKQQLDRQKIPSELMPSGVDPRIDTLYIPFEGVKFGLKLTYIPSEVLNVDNVVKKVSLLQYDLTLPLEIRTEQVTQVSHYINALNLAIPIPGWTLDEKNSSINFRYVQLNPGGQYPPDELPTYLIQLVAFYITRYVPALVDLCSGKKTFEEVESLLQAKGNPKE
jgi:hypothetical protein